MPEVSQFYRQQRLAPLSGVGNLSAADIAAATQGNRDLAKSGEAITEFGIAFMEQKEKAEYHNQLNTARTEYLTKFFNYEQDLQTNADTETYIPNLKAGQTSSFKFTNKRAADEFELWKANEDLSQTRRVFGAKNDRDVQNYTDNWNLGIKEATRRTASAVSESDYQFELANGMDYFGLEYATEEKDGEPVPVLDEKGNPTIQLIEDWENPLLDTDAVRMAGYKSWKADVDAKRKVIMNGNAVGIGFAVWEASIPEDGSDPDGDLTAGFKAIRENPNVSEGDKQEVESELKTRVQNQRAENRLRLEAAQEQQLDDINKQMYTEKNYTAAAAAIEASDLSEREQGSLLRENDTRARLAANGQAETNDPVAVDEVSTAIAQVGNDTLPLEDAKKVLNENRHLLKSEKVVEFQEELNKEFDRSVDTAYSRVRGDVRLRAIGKTESALDRLIEGLVGVPADEQKSLEDRITTARKKFNLELDNFNRWEDSIRAWRRKEENRAAAPEEIQKEGLRSWITDYSRKTPEQLEAISEAERSRLNPTKPRRSDLIKSKPPVKMQSPDGRTGTIPADQVEAAIAAGWKKL